MRLKLLAAAAVAALTIAGPALAADLPSPVAPPIFIPPPSFSWTGFYVGINGGDVAGYTYWNYHLIPSGAAVGQASHETNGGLIGGTVGYNYQFASSFVVGLEADFGWADVNGTTACPNAAFTCQSKINDLGTARGRIGWTPVDRVLLYGTGGLAWGNVDVRTINTTGAATPPSGTPVNGTNLTRVGWAVGGGAEWAVWQSVSFKFEYIRYQFSPATYGVDNSGAFNVSARQDGNLFRAGINYKFDWAPPPAPVPVIAKY